MASTPFTHRNPAPRRPHPLSENILWGSGGRSAPGPQPATAATPGKGAP